MPLNIEKQIRQGLPQVGVAPYRQIHVHSTGNPRSTAQNEADYHSRRPVESGFFSHVVGNGRIIQTAPTGRGAYDVGGGWNAEGYGHIELIESHGSYEEFRIDYELFVDLARQLAQEAGLPVTLDGASRDTDGTPMGIISHAYCTANQPNNFSDHVDPYPYLARWGITKEQFAKDLAKGFENTQKTKEEKKEEENDMITISAPGRGIALMMGGKFLPILDAKTPTVFWGQGIKHFQLDTKTFDAWQGKAEPSSLDDATVKKLIAGLK